jgi:hypothetical protein
MRVGRFRVGRTTALLACVVAFLGVVATIAQAELSVSGDLFVTFNGGIAPAALPRDALAPISVRVGGRVRTLTGEHPPALREVTIALNRAGHLDSRGLPICHKSQVESVSGTQALATCASALVGTGTYRGKIAFPGQTPTSINGRILAFNSTSGGHSTILAQIYGPRPVPSTRVIVFQISHPAGLFGTVLKGSLPPSLNRWGYVKRISFNFHRLFTYRGKTHSYLSANCRAPSGVSEASFPFAYTSMAFADGRSLSATLTRTCTVK